MVKLFHINIPLAVATLMEMAAKQERNKCSGDHWFNLAMEVEAGKYVSLKQVNQLVGRYPFLKRFQQ